MSQYKVRQIYDTIKSQCDEDEYPLCINFSVPGSKSITNRVLLMAALAEGESNISNLAKGEDVDTFIKCLTDLGFDISLDEKKKNAHVIGSNGSIPKKKASINVGNAGTAARFITTVLALSDGEYRIDANDQMKTRPMEDLFEALETLGAHFSFECNKNSFPFILKGCGANLSSSEITVDISKSSQFYSGLLLAAPLLKENFEIKYVGEHGLSYIDMTLSLLDTFGVKATFDNSKTILESIKYKGCDYRVEPDMSSACYIYAMAPLLGVPACVNGIGEDSIQADYQFINVLYQMGCEVDISDDLMTIYPPANGELIGVMVNMGSCPDQAMTAAILACFANRPSMFSGLDSLKYKECDRLSAIEKELGKLGIKVEINGDTISVYPGSPTGGVIDTYDDHRMAMAFALLGLRSNGIVIDNPECVKKTFPSYFEAIDALCDHVLS